MSTAAPIKPLGAAQRPIAQHLVEGSTNEQIAKRLCLSANTVASHVRRIRAHLHCDTGCSRAVLAHTLLKHRLVRPPALPPLFDSFAPSPGVLLLVWAIAEHSAHADIAHAAQIAPSALQTRALDLMYAMRAGNRAHLVGLGHTLGILTDGPARQPAPCREGPPGEPDPHRTATTLLNPEANAMPLPDYGAPAFDEDTLRRPSASRIAHLLVGGHRDAYDADTDLKDQLLTTFHGLETAARIGRVHRTLTARYFTRLGFRQFIDLGCGYPSPDSSHPDIHHLIHPHHPGVAGVPVVYVEADHLAFSHARALAFGAEGVHHVLADIRNLPELLNDLGEITRGAMRRDVPVAVFAHDVLPWIPDLGLDPALAALRAWLPAGSALSITHPTGHFGQQEVMSQLTSLYEAADITYLPRPYSAVARMFGDWIQQGPGIQAVARWHTDHPDNAAPEHASAAYAGIAIKPAGRLP